jgi:hypothetical protein
VLAPLIIKLAGIGSGGSEYSFILIVALLVIAAGDEKEKTK